MTSTQFRFLIYTLILGFGGIIAVLTGFFWWFVAAVVAWEFKGVLQVLWAHYKPL